MRKINRRILNLILVMAVLLGGISAGTVITQASGRKTDAGTGKPEKMEVHFIDVGQGDATLVTCGGHSMLIDAGDNTKGTAVQNYLKKQNVKKLDYLVLTHPDADHIGGAAVIVTKFKIDKVFMSDFEKDNKTYQNLIRSLDNKHLKYITPKAGSTYTLGTAEITMLAPNDSYDNPNDASVALIIKNGKNRFLFTGDAEENAEADILANGIDISADVYKAGHHGSRTSTSQKFFEAVKPSSAVISCAEDNSYGHPHAETLNTFRMNKVAVYRTDEAGTIIASSDGEKITFNVPSSETWKAGEPNGNASVWEAPEQKAGSPEPDSGVDTDSSRQGAGSQDTNELTYVLNVKTKKFHRPSCSGLPTTNRLDSSESRESIIAQGYVPCKKCNP